MAKKNEIAKAEADAIQPVEQIKRLDAGDAKPEHGIFFDGQIFDSYSFINDRIREAKKRIILIDNYIDDTVYLVGASLKDLGKKWFGFSKMLKKYRPIPDVKLVIVSGNYCFRCPYWQVQYLH